MLGILLLLWLIKSLGVFGTCLLYRLYAGVVLHWVHFLVEVLRAEVAKVRECKDWLTFLGLLSGNLNDLFLLYYFNLSLEEAFSSDHLCVLHYHSLHLRR